MHRKLEQKSDLCRSPKILGPAPGPQERSCRGAAESLEAGGSTYSLRIWNLGNEKGAWTARKSKPFIWHHNGEYWAALSGWIRSRTLQSVRRLVSTLKDLPFIIADRHHSLFGHICRLSAEVPVHQAL